MPPLSFLVSAGDSTFWVEHAASRLTVRRSPMLLTEVAGRFYELYLTDDDRSFYDALFVGQRIYRRDLATGDSLLLFEDATLARLAADYAATHPNDAPLGPDDDASEDPSTTATTETELLDVAGPFLTIERHVDIDMRGDRDQHVTRRAVLDVRDGHAVSVADLVGARQAADIHREGQRLLSATLDSVRRAGDERARRASAALTGFTFDSTSFALVDEDGAPAIAFLVPGRGARAGGYSLPLGPLRISEGPWWASIRASLPMPRAESLTWRGDGYDVVVRADSAADSMQLVVRAGPNEWPVARVPAPVRRVTRIDRPAPPAPTLEALRRAFSESALYSGELRTASTAPAQPPTARLVARR